MVSNMTAITLHALPLTPHCHKLRKCTNIDTRRNRAALPESTRADLAASFQHTAIRHLEERVRRAMDACEKMARASFGASSNQVGAPKVKTGVGVVGVDVVLLVEVAVAVCVGFSTRWATVVACCNIVVLWRYFHCRLCSHTHTSPLICVVVVGDVG